MDKKHIAVITPGVLPVPCSQGGAVETLVEFYLQENENRNKYYFHVYSVYDEKAEEMSLKYKYTKFHFFHPHNFFIRLKRHFYMKTNNKFYYDSYMDYYGHWALQKIKKQNINLLIVENRQGFIIDKIFKKIKCPKILHLHNDTLNNRSLFAKEILDGLDKVLTVSGYIKQQVDSIANTNKVKIVYNGIDIDKFINSQPIYQRKDLGLSDEDFVVIYAGRISPIKGVRELLQAFLLLKDYSKIKLLVVGGSNYGDKTNSPFFEEMKSLARKIGNQIVFTGYIPYKTIPAILKLGNIGIIPSICEDAFTLSSIESMVSGLPLIVTKSGGIPEAVDEYCAVIIEKDKKLIESIAKTIIHLHEHPQKIQAMSERGIIRGMQFDKSTYTSNIMHEINCLL